MQQSKLWANVRAARAMLDIHHPGLFDLEKPRPLTCGIRDEIAGAYPEIPVMVLSKLLWWLTQRRGYLRAAVAGSPRWGLTGQHGAVTAQQAAYSAGLFAKRDAQAKDKWPVAA